MKKDRNRNILKAVVQEYIRTAEPVSSKAVAERHRLGLSPATIRNAMAELEEEGLLVQPHTSAGRIPTDKGFRFYLDSLLEPEKLMTSDKDLLKTAFDGSDTVNGVLASTARTLSSMTNCAGLMFIPRKDFFTIKHISLVRMDSGVMVIMVSRLGMVRSKHVKLARDAASLDLERISNYLNSMGEGLTVRELRSRIVEEMKKEKNLYDRLLGNALKLGAMALANDTPDYESDIFLEGSVNIFDQPEFRDDVVRMKKLFAAFEEKSLLVRILDKSLEEDGIHVYLGSENRVEEFDKLSFVTATYGSEGEMLGTLGVIGPVRMNYSRVIPLVEYAAGLLGKAF